MATHAVGHHKQADGRVNNHRVFVAFPATLVGHAMGRERHRQGL
jgi:hypothetical protein